MGAWDTGVFDNDSAADWAHVLDGGGVRHIHETLLRAAEGGEFLDADEGAEALAAAETVARLLGGAWVESPYSAGVDEWVARQSGTVPDELRAVAIAAVNRTLGEGSELLDLWEESGDGPLADWRRVAADLLERLGD